MTPTPLQPMFAADLEHPDISSDAVIRNIEAAVDRYAVVVLGDEPLDDAAQVKRDMRRATIMEY